MFASGQPGEITMDVFEGITVLMALLSGWIM
jgi:hypothetical protein